MRVLLHEIYVQFTLDLIAFMSSRPAQRLFGDP